MLLIKNPKFSLLSLSFLLSAVANWIYKLALPIMILNITGSAYHAASMFGISFIPWVLFSLFGGVVADSFRKNRIIWIGNLTASVLTIGLLLGFMVRPLNLVLIYTLVFFLSSVDPLVHPSFQSLIPEIVPEKDFVKANANIQTIDNFLSVIGPLVGGGIVTLFGGSITILIAVIFFFLAAIMDLFIPSKSTHHNFSVRTLLSDVKVGAQYSVQQKVIFSGSMMFFFTNFGTNMFEANFMYFMTRNLGLTVFNTTIAMAIAGLGSILAGFVADKVISPFRSGQVLIVSTILAGLATLLLVTTRNYIIIGIILGIVSFLGTINVITYFSLRQKTVPQNLLGRVVAVTRMVSYASIPVGAWFGGYLLNNGFSMTVVILIAGLIRGLTGVVAHFTPLANEK
ncbi:MFS transporter [Fructilactobacillus cliffordii]|uniref:MFS transporter n=1 Tax=Fructilactobacillus cliffordii TaxID=2940299 RepID=A0A9Q9E2V3_9LACO|nr:MFS transporter [Fructilactobacillus cliffordii]USS88958.1 MFS transporter [Fructilactobacillus cliffordii]